MKIIWSPRARKHLQEYVDYIAQDNLEAARAWQEGLIEKVGRIGEFPGKGRVVPEDGRPSVREVFYKSHRIIYKITSKDIIILTIRHSKQLIDVKEL